MIDRSVQYPNRYQLTEVSNGVYDLIPAPGTITQEGTPISKATMFDDNNVARYNVDEPDDAFKALVKEWNVIVQASNWSSAANSDGYYTNTISVTGMRSNFTPIFALNDTNAETIDDSISAFAELKRMTTANGSVTFLALDKPDINIPVRIKGV